LGVVEVRHGQGIFVKGFDFDALIESLSYSLSVEGRHICELLEVREGLEVVFAQTAATNATQEDIEELETIVARMKAKAARREIFPEEDRQFHLSLYRCSGNSLLLKLIDIFWIVFRQLRAAWLEIGWEVDAVVTADDHAAILEALKLGNIDLVRQRIVDHYVPLRRQLIEKGLGEVGRDVALTAVKSEDSSERA
jgi:DNA-binding FadR family transcriptional regulator